MGGLFHGYIQAVCVAPEWRNRGIGSQLMAAAEKRIFSETSSAYVCALSLSQNVLKLYERLGYEVIGDLKSSEILLRKSR